MSVALFSAQPASFVTQALRFTHSLKGLNQQLTKMLDFPTLGRLIMPVKVPPTPMPRWLRPLCKRNRPKSKVVFHDDASPHSLGRFDSCADHSPDLSRHPFHARR